MNIPHLDPITLASFIAVAALGLSRLLATTKPIWDRLPPLLQGLFPVLALVLPQIAASAAGVKTSLDLVNLVALAVTLVLPGLHSHTVEMSKPKGPGSGALMMLVFVLSIGAGLACSTFGPVSWPKVAACADSLEQPLVESVAKVLAGTGDVESELGDLVKSGAAADAVVCAVKQLLSDFGTAPVTARSTNSVARGRAFLAKVEQ